jgi:hypothetical protein
VIAGLVLATLIFATVIFTDPRDLFADAPRYHPAPPLDDAMTAGAPARKAL